MRDFFRNIKGAFSLLITTQNQKAVEIKENLPKFNYIIFKPSRRESNSNVYTLDKVS